jgi:ASPIC and UnbV/FG-GAP-like repeat
MKFQHFLVILLCFPVCIAAQISFSDKTGLLSTTDHHSGVAIAVADMNADGLDDIIRLNDGKEISIEYQTAPGAPFGTLSIGNSGGNNKQWGICVADVDNNGFPDILTGGSYDNVKIYRAINDGTAYVKTTLNNSNIFVQGVNFTDVNNDGWLDAFACHDDGTARIFGNNGDGTMTFQPMWIDLTTFPSSNNSGNYGSVWSDIDNDGDLDLYIAKCRQGVGDPSDPRRINQLFLNNGDGTYTQDIDDLFGLRIGAQSWTADFGDIDNDGDFDCFITNHDVSSQLLENDGAGHFTDISVSAGLDNAVNGLAIQGVFEDFDNDGLVDILVSGQIDYLFRNEGNKTFSEVDVEFGSDNMESFALGDLDHDGYVDVYAGYAEIFNNPSNVPDALWMNEGSGKNYIGFRLRGAQSNRDGVGAKIRIYTAAGTQVREVRSGQSYGISNSLSPHFGLDTLTQIDSALIFWPSGTIDRIYAPGINQYIVVNEGGCISNAISISANGPTTFCTGQSVEIIAPAGYSSYLWNNGDSTQSIIVDSAGLYSVSTTDTLGCVTVSPPVVIIVDPVQIPVIEAMSDTVFCEGASVQLVCSPATSYLWSNGANTQSIIVSETGNYSVAAQGLCAVFSSASMGVTALSNPAPKPIGDTVAVGSTAILLANCTNPNWFENPNDLVPVHVLNEFVLLNNIQSDTFWVSNKTEYDQPNANVGMKDHQGGTFSDNSYEGGLIFDAFAPFTIAKAKVYTNVAGEREIEVRDEAGTVLQSVMVNIPSGTSVIELGLEVPIGQNFLLTTNSETNQSSIGTNGPQLRRSNMGVSYPYLLADVVNIKASTFDSTSYYYFFDWEIDVKGFSCESPRLPVVLLVDSSLVHLTEPAWAADLNLFPNPSSELISLETASFPRENVLLSLMNAQGITLFRNTLSAPEGLLSHIFSVKDLPAGPYWITLQEADRAVSVRRKFVKN